MSIDSTVQTRAATVRRGRSLRAVPSRAITRDDVVRSQLHWSGWFAQRILWAPNAYRAAVDAAVAAVQLGSDQGEAYVSNNPIPLGVERAPGEVFLAAYTADPHLMDALESALPPEVRRAASVYDTAADAWFAPRQGASPVAAALIWPASLRDEVPMRAKAFQIARWWMEQFLLPSTAFTQRLRTPHAHLDKGFAERHPGEDLSLLTDVAMAVARCELARRWLESTAMDDPSRPMVEALVPALQAARDSLRMGNDPSGFRTPEVDPEAATGGQIA